MINLKKNNYGDNMMLLYTDTDSFKLLIKTCNPYELKKIWIRRLC